MIVGGAQENTLLNCLDLQRDWNDDVVLITGPSPGPEGQLLSQGRGGGLNVVIVPELQRAISPWKDYKALQAIKRVLREYQPQVVHTHSAKGGILGRQAAYDLQVPAIIHTVHGAPFHDLQAAPVRWLYRTLERRAAKQCHLLVCVADAMRELIVNSGVAPPDQCVTVYSGMAVEPFLKAREQRVAVRTQLGFRDDDVVVGKIARLFDLKGHDDLITAAANLKELHPNLRYLLVGDGTLRSKLEQRIADLGLSDRFVFTGLVPPEDVPRYLGAMDLLVHCSLREGLARALPQALISGIPAISYDIDGAREVVLTDRTGVLVPAQNISRLTTAISRLAADAKLRQEFGEQGRGLFAEQFCHHTMTRKLRALYQQVLAGQRHWAHAS